MDASSDASVADGFGGGAAPRRPHWRHRDRSATVVYVVHPDQFRAVVHQLTGAAAPPPSSQQPAHGRRSDNCNALKAAAMAVETAKSRSGSMEQRTLAQLHHDCMAWADEC